MLNYSEIEDVRHREALNASQGPWRDKNYLVINPRLHKMPEICIYTGRRNAGERRAIRIDYFPYQYAIVAIFAFVGAAAMAIIIRAAIDLPGIFGAAIGGALAGAAAGLGPTLARRLRRTRGWTIDCNVSARRNELSANEEFLHFLLSPAMAILSIGLLLYIQTFILSDLNWAIHLLTWILVLFFIFFLAIIAWGVSKKMNEKPRDCDLVCRHFDGKYAWVIGIHSRLLDSLPIYKPN